MSTFARIVGTGMAVPERVLTNRDLEQRVETSDEWIRTRTGIAQRHVVDDDTASSDLAVAAARPALEAAGIQANELDLIVVATVTPDMVFPSTACLVQRELGAKGCMAFDMAAACSGFLYALGCVDSMIKSGMARRALVVGVDANTTILNWEDRGSCVLFGDGAGAVVVTPSDSPGLVSFDLGAEGQHADLLTVPGSGSRKPDFDETTERKYNTIHLNGSPVFKHAVRVMSASIVRACERAGIAREKLKRVIPHQANKRIIDAVRDRVGLTDEQMVVNVDRYGNTTAGTIPIALDEIVRDGQLEPGDPVGLVAFGGGLTWGAAILRW